MKNGHGKSVGKSWDINNYQKVKGFFVLSHEILPDQNFKEFSLLLVLVSFCLED